MEKYISIATIACFFIYIAYQVYNVYKTDRDGVLVKTKIEFVKYLSGNDGGSTNIAFVLRANIDEKDVILKGTKSIATFYSSQLMPGEYVNIKYRDEKHFIFVFKEQAE